MNRQHSQFLKDAFLFSVTAFGGPMVHISIMLDLFVKKRQYLTEKELVELIALCQMLPGPTSTQTLTSIGYKTGGTRMAILTLLIWMFPAVVLMSATAIFFTFAENRSGQMDFLQFAPPVAVGFIVFAAWKIGSKVLNDTMTWLILIFSTLFTVLLHDPWIFPAVLIAGGLISYFLKKDTSHHEKEISRYRIRWVYLTLFILIFVLTGLISIITQNKAVALFENFYRFGSLIFGGGQVLIPMMHEQLVNHKEYLTSDEFLSGYGIVQAYPGPVFSFAAFAGGIAFQQQGILWQIFGSFISAVAIFLPGTLLIFFVYPVWEYIKKYEWIKRALSGVNAAAAGLVAAAAILLFKELDINLLNTLLVIITFLTLKFTRIPAPFVILTAVGAGFLI